MSPTDRRTAPTRYTQIATEKKYVAKDGVLGNKIVAYRSGQVGRRCYARSRPPDPMFKNLGRDILCRRMGVAPWFF